MANLLATDELTINVKYGDSEEKIRVVYGDFFKAVYEKSFAVFEISDLDAPKYALFQDNGTRLPKSARIYDNAEVSDGCTVELKLK